MNFENATVGIVDVGSNSIKLLIARRGGDATIEFVDFFTEEIRIGEGITGTPPAIEKSAIDQGAAAIKRLISRAMELRVNTIAVIATSAAREASNKQEFAHAVERACGHELRILSGDEEAKLIGRGILCDPQLNDLRDFTLIDLGGGSLERIVFKDRKASKAKSLPLGAVRLSNLHIRDRNIPLAPSEQALIENHVVENLKANGITSNDCSSDIAVLTGGSATLIGNQLDKDGLGRASLSQLIGYRDQIIAANRADRIDRYSVPEARADIMPTAAVILSCVLNHLECQDIRFSNYNLRFGIAHTLLIDQTID